jgi:hypothetical protein
VLVAARRHFDLSPAVLDYFNGPVERAIEHGGVASLTRGRRGDVEGTRHSPRVSRDMNMRTQNRRHKTVTASDTRPFSKVIVWSACGPLLVAFLMLMPAAPHAQQERPEALPPGVSWDKPPSQQDVEVITQGGSAERDAQDHSNARTGSESTESHQEQNLVAQQAIAEQARRLAILTYWQIAIGAAVLIGLALTIFYTRQTARAVAVALDPSKRASSRIATLEEPNRLPTRR